jgi:hypothetical protein
VGLRAKWFGLAAIGLCIFSRAVLAQDIDAKALEQSRKILEMTHMAALGEQMIALMVPKMTDLLVQANPERGAVAKEIFEQYGIPSLRESMPEFIDTLAMTYAKHFTADELSELVTFYQTPLGQKLIDTQPALMNEASVIGQQWGAKAAQNMLKKIAPLFKERGLQVPI